MFSSPAVLASLVLPFALTPPTIEEPLVEARVNLPSHGWDWATTTVDWDGDGDLDVLLPRQVGGINEPAEIVLYRNDGHARFREGGRVTLPLIIYAYDFATGDVDGDGDADALVRGSASGTCFVLRNDGEGGFEPGIELLAGLGLVWEMMLFDVDADGRLDAVFGTSSGAYLLRNQGGGIFSIAPELLAGLVASVRDLDPADFDGDGVVDLAMGGDRIRILRNDGTGTFSLHQQFPVGGWDVAAGDIDGDGDTDLVSSGAAGHLFRNDGSGVLHDDSASLLAPPGADLQLVELDHDGDLDIASRGGILINRGGGVFEASTTAFPGHDYNEGEGVLADDLDGDGDADLLIGNLNRVLLGDGTGAFVDTGDQVTFSRQLAALAMSDVDGDGDPDAVVYDPQFALEAVLLRNDGRGVFERDEELLPSFVNYHNLAFGDVDGDGDEDLLAGQGQPQLLLNDGAGHFTKAPPGCVPQNSGEVHRSEFGDLDGDGDLDLFIGRVYAYPHGGWGPTWDTVWFNDGSGCFIDTPSALPAITAHLTESVALGDIDGDGDLDILTNGPQLFRNDGTGQFTDDSHDLAFLTEGNGVGLGDLDGDGDLDAYFGSKYPRDVIMWNDGQGHFLDTTPAPGQLTRNPSFVDFDGDGDLDLVSGVFYHEFPHGGVAESMATYANDGAGNFTPLRGPQDEQHEYALADLDLDGDIDLFNGSRTFLNRRRSLTWGARPRLGHPLVLELAGSPQRPYILFAATTLHPHFVPPYGLRWLDPHDIFHAAGGYFDAAGQAERHYAIPDDPALLDVTVYWQALIGAPMRLSNLEVTTPVDF